MNWILKCEFFRVLVFVLFCFVGGGVEVSSLGKRTSGYKGVVV